MHNMSRVGTNLWCIFGALCALLAASCGSPSSSPSLPSGTPSPETTVITTPISSAGCGKPAPTPPGSSVYETVFSGGLKRTYLLHVPSGYQANSSEAVVLNFHGHGSNAVQQERRSGMSLLADQQGFIAVYPQGVVGPDGQTGWDTGALERPQVNDVLFVSDLLNHLQGILCIDPLRIYATGFSNGGGMTNVLACTLAGRLAAFAPVSGSYPPYPGGCHPVRPVPILEFHGTADPIVPYNGSARKRYPPILTWLQGWATRDGCTRGPTVFYKQGERDGTGVDKLPGKCNRYTVSYFRGRPCMASRYFQQARRNFCDIPQRFGPDLVVFPAAFSTCYFSDRLSAARTQFVAGRNKSTWHISIVCRLVLLQKEEL